MLTTANDKPVATNPNFVFNYDLTVAPRGKKLILLNSGHVAVLGPLSGNPKRDAGIIAWCELPVRNKTIERDRKLI